MDQENITRLGVLNTHPISGWPYPRILVGIPLERAISYADRVFVNFLRIAAFSPHFIDRPYGRIDVVRNLMVEDLLSRPRHTHLLLLDIDHKHPVDIIQRLAKWVILFPEVRVIGGMNFRRQPPYDPVMGNVTDNVRPLVTSWDPGLIRVDEIGAASLLVHRSVFENMDPPWFANDYSRIWENNWPGEDIGFCRKCKDNGIDVYADTTTVSPHCTDGLVDEDTYRTYMQDHPEKFQGVRVQHA